MEATYYVKTVEDLILGSVPPNSTGITQFITNAGELENRGVELAVNASVLRMDDVNWLTSIAWWTNEAEITELNIPDDYITAFGAPVLGGVLRQEGVSPTAIGGTDANGDVVELGDFQPDFQLSWSNDFTLFKNWDLSFLFHGAFGGENIQLSNLLRDSGGNTDDFFDGSSATPTDRGPFITEERFVEDATYIKLREASLYYNVPTKFLNDFAGNVIRGAKVGVSGTNLFFITDYDGYDPEVSNFGSQAVLQSVSVTPFPPARRVMFHVKLDL